MAIAHSIPHLSVPVSDASQVGEARRAARIIAEDSGFDADQIGKIAIVVTEAATNLSKHAKNGEVLLCPHRDSSESSWIDVLAIDRGPGIRNIAQSVADGFSTAGTAGTGLGAIARLSDHFEIFSDQASGTALLARIQSHGASVRKSVVEEKSLRCAFIAIPKKGEKLCGDVVNLHLRNGNGSFLVADGLGHGISAHEAAREAANIFSEEADASAAEVLDSVHRGLRSTRGAAVAVATIDSAMRTVRYAGVGNIATTILSDGTSRSLISHNGIVGHQAHKIQEFTYPWQDSAVMVMNSDGLQTNWRVTQYPGLIKKDPAIIAAVLYRDFSRGRDDASVLVVKGEHA